MNRYASIVLIVTVGCLSALGLVTLFNAEHFSDSANFERHLLWMGIGLASCYAFTMIDYRHWQSASWCIFVLAAILLILCHIPPIGREINGAYRWVKIGPFQFQPSEPAKLAGILFLASWYTRYRDRAGTTLYGFLLPGICVCLLVGLIAREVDIGAATLLGIVTGIVMLMAGVRYHWLILGVIGAFGSVGAAIKLLPERTARFLAFLNPEKYRDTEGWQQEKSLEAFGVGGLDGVGLGKVMQSNGVGGSRDQQLGVRHVRAR